MCENPKTPGFPVYREKSWYYAYGNSSHKQILEDTRLIVDLADGNKNRPFMVIDDEWQVCHNNSCNGGPWTSGNYKFPDIMELAVQMKGIGSRPGIWMRPLLTASTVPQSFRLPEARFLPQHRNAWKDAFLDPSIPEVLEIIA